MPLMTVLVIFVGNIELYLVTYCVMTIHEFAHYLASIVIGLKGESITFSAFGVNLKLRNKLLSSLSDEIILYGSGPLINGILALIAVILDNTTFYRINISLFIMNLLPIIPLDGGMIALRLLSYYFGLNTSKKILKVFSSMIAVIFLAVAVVGMIYHEINLSVFIISVFFIGNVLTSKEKYDTDIINCLSLPKKRSNKARITVINGDFTIPDSIKGFSPAYTTIAVVTDHNGKIENIISEKEILEKYQEYLLE